MVKNKEGLLGFEGMSKEERELVGRRGWAMFPRALKRWREYQEKGQ
jgi:hypothetical protein